MKATSIKNLDQNYHSLDFKSKVQTAFDSFLNGGFHFSYGNKVLPARASDTLRLFSQTRAIVEPKLHRNLFLNYLINCERKAPGGSFAFLLHFLSEHKETKYGRVDAKQLSVLLSNYVGSGEIKDLVCSIINQAGYDFDLQYTSSRVDKLALEVLGSHRVDAYLDVLLDRKPLENVEANIYCVDGKIDAVGEIDVLIRWSINNGNSPVVLIANSYNPDVVNTIKQNNLNVFPYVFKSIKEDDMSDLAQKIGAPLISTKTGLRFSNLDLEDFDKNNCNLGRKRIVIKHTHGERKSVLIHIPERLNSVRGIIEDRVKLGLLLVKNAAKFGICRLQSGAGVYYVTNNATEFAKKANENWYGILNNVGCVIYTEEN